MSTAHPEYDATLGKWYRIVRKLRDGREVYEREYAPIEHSMFKSHRKAT